MKIQHFGNLRELNIAFTNLIKQVLSEKEYITLALSGGSTPKSLFDYWAANCKTEIDWLRIKFFWGDERCVPPTDDESNYKMTKEHLFNHLPIPPEHIFRIHGENNPKEEASRYSSILKNELKIRNGLPSFDILMLGMGNDGHTASIFPQEIDLWNSNSLCVEATHPVTTQKRISITGKVINSAQHVAFLVTGESKSEKISEIILSPKLSEKKYPAALVHPYQGNLYWFLDKKAAQGLDKNI